jgi:hypothetical protein
MPDLSFSDVAATALQMLLNGLSKEPLQNPQLFATRFERSVCAAAEHLLDQAAATERMLDADEVRDRTLETVNEYRDEILSRATLFETLDQDQLNGVVTSLVQGLPVEAQRPEWREALDRDLTDRQDLLNETARRLAANAPDLRADDLRSSLEANDAFRLDKEAAERRVLQSLNSGYPATMAGLAAELARLNNDLAARRARPEEFNLEESIRLREQGQQMELDLHLAAGLLRQESAIALEATRQAAEALCQFQQGLAQKGIEPAIARDLLERFAQRADERLIAYVAQEPTDPRRAVLWSLSEEPEVREAARRHVDCALGRQDPWRGEPDLQRSQPDLAYLHTVEFHGQNRLETVAKVFELVSALKESGAIRPDDAILTGGAQFQLGEGSLLDRTAAAHKLPGQILLGLAPEENGSPTPAIDPRPNVRLDDLVPRREDELRLAVRGWFATTTELPLHVNAVDSLWEGKGLREAFRGAVEYVVQQPREADRLAVLTEAYQRFREDALAALDFAREHNEAQLRALQRAEPSPAQDPRTLTPDDRLQMRQVLDEYQRMLQEIDFEKLRTLVHGPRT